MHSLRGLRQFDAEVMDLGPDLYERTQANFRELITMIPNGSM